MDCGKYYFCHSVLGVFGGGGPILHMGFWFLGYNFGNKIFCCFYLAGFLGSMA